MLGVIHFVLFCFCVLYSVQSILDFFVFHLLYSYRVVILGDEVHQEGYSPGFSFDGLWDAVLVVESWRPFHLLVDVLLGTLGTKFGISI